ncbi:MAG TPA: carboxymuconolactone decarboxylase family protein [Thermoanaerobaculales bacterium]|nr:carboxymuconolactone decarboxylase family protein [Thermoanaerobaculales bacterium]HQN97731.1 carboxymuconolactone decarboxylase family protein [Thermoanaerobaculales bacterium]HQP44994.1 carboxymuconolactone decarboxylase family protein [Thermoanaerobaculales bacterium]
MNDGSIPAHYQSLKARYPEVMAALEALGAAARAQGPLDEPTSHLVRIAAAAAIGSEGAVHSHARRALAAGASAEQVRHAVLLLATTIGFPRAAAAMSWVDDIIDGPRGAAARRG